MRTSFKTKCSLEQFQNILINTDTLAAADEKTQTSTQTDTHYIQS